MLKLIRYKIDGLCNLYCVSEASSISMILSNFSHHSALHLFINMYVLWSFSLAITDFLGREQFVAMYLSAGKQHGLVSF